jgi:hypothetical protein
MLVVIGREENLSRGRRAIAACPEYSSTRPARAGPAWLGHSVALAVGLQLHILETNDNGFIPEGSPLEGHDESRAAGAYPIRRVMRLARDRERA